MNVLTLTRTHGTPDTSSQAQGPLALMSAAVRADPSLRFRWPIVRSYAKYGDQFSAEGVEAVYELADGPTRMLGFKHDARLIELIEEADVVLSNQVAQNLWLRRYARLVNLQMWGMTPRLAERYPIGPECEITAEAIGTLAAPNVWESTIQQAETLRYLSEWVREPVDPGVVLPLGVNMTVLDEVYARRTEVPAMFWCGELHMPHKGWAESSAGMAKVRTATGCEAIVSTRVDEWPNPHGLDMHWQTSRSEFLSLMSRGAVFLMNCTWESYGLAWLEMLGAGLLGVYMDAWWVRHVLPDWYPFVVDDEEDQIELAVVLIRQYPDGPLWAKYQPAVREWVRETNSIESGGRRLAEVLRG